MIVWSVGICKQILFDRGAVLTMMWSWQIPFRAPVRQMEVNGICINEYIGYHLITLLQSSSSRVPSPFTSLAWNYYGLAKVWTAECTYTLISFFLRPLAGMYTFAQNRWKGNHTSPLVITLFTNSAHLRRLEISLSISTVTLCFGLYGKGYYFWGRFMTVQPILTEH